MSRPICFCQLSIGLIGSRESRPPACYFVITFFFHPIDSQLNWYKCILRHVPCIFPLLVSYFFSLANEIFSDTQLPNDCDRYNDDSVIDGKLNFSDRCTNRLCWAPFFPVDSWVQRNDGVWSKQPGSDAFVHFEFFITQSICFEHVPTTNPSVALCIWCVNFHTERVNI